MRTKTLIAGVLALVLLGGCGASAGSEQHNHNVEVALRALYERCQPHEGLLSYSFRFQSTKYLWTAICKDGEPIVVGGD
jgi:hypothetical protein